MHAARSGFLPWWIPLALVLAAGACANPLAPQPIPTPAALPTLLPPVTQTPAPAVLSTDSSGEIVLVPYVERWFQVLFPAAWQVGGGYLPNEWTFAPPDRPQYGLRVRFEGTGYSSGLLDALINDEIEAMRRAGLAPQEIAIRRPEQLLDGHAVGRSADFTGSLETIPVRVQVTAVVTDATTAYVLRLVAPREGFDAEGYGAAYARIVREFAPVYAPDAAATRVASPTPLPVSESPPTAAPTAAASIPTPAPTGEPLPATVTSAVFAFGPEPYTTATFEMRYPSAWAATVNAAGDVTFLAPDPALLVGISVTVLGGPYNPDADPTALLDTYLDEVAASVPDTVIGQERALEAARDQAYGISATYVVPYTAEERLVYRVTILVSHAAGGTAYRILQWAPESLYEGGYRDLYRAVVAAFRPLPVEDPLPQEGP